MIARAFVIVGALIATVGCYDFSLITEVPIVDAGTVDVTPPPSDGDAGTNDDAASAGSAACVQCLSAGECAPKMATCRSTARCEPFFVCAVELGCLKPGAALVDCLTVCGQKIGLTTSSDPLVAPFMALMQCGTKECPDTCAQ